MIQQSRDVDDKQIKHAIPQIDKPMWDHFI